MRILSALLLCGVLAGCSSTADEGDTTESAVTASELAAAKATMQGVLSGAIPVQRRMGWLRDGKISSEAPVDADGELTRAITVDVVESSADGQATKLLLSGPGVLYVVDVVSGATVEATQDIGEGTESLAATARASAVALMKSTDPAATSDDPSIKPLALGGNVVVALGDMLAGRLANLFKGIVGERIAVVGEKNASTPFVYSLTGANEAKISVRGGLSAYDLPKGVESVSAADLQPWTRRGPQNMNFVVATSSSEALKTLAPLIERRRFVHLGKWFSMEGDPRAKFRLFLNDEVLAYLNKLVADTKAEGRELTAVANIFGGDSHMSEAMAALLAEKVPGLKLTWVMAADAALKGVNSTKALPATVESLIIVPPGNELSTVAGLSNYAIINYASLTPDLSRATATNMRQVFMTSEGRARYEDFSKSYEDIVRKYEAIPNPSDDQRITLSLNREYVDHYRWIGSLVK